MPATIWFEGYVRTYLERDLAGLSAIASLPDFRRLMRAICLRLGQPANQAALGREVALPQATVHRHLPPPLSEPPFRLRIRLRMRFWSSVQRRPR